VKPHPVKVTAGYFDREEEPVEAAPEPALCVTHVTPVRSRKEKLDKPAQTGRRRTTKNNFRHLFDNFNPTSSMIGYMY
jgi:hypothetical protein